MDLAGKVAIITGSTSGIGKAAAELFTEHGVHVLIHGRDQARGEELVSSLESQPGETLFVKADLLDQAAPKDLVDAAIKRWGRLDFIVNNAALVCNKSLDQIQSEDWQRLLQVNLQAPFFIVQAALPWLKESKGAVVNVSSINGIRNKSENLIYDSIKAGLNHMTQGLALDLRKHGIRCNGLMPGGVATPLINQWFHQFVENPEEAERQAEAEKLNPFMGSPKQIADAIVYLCSKQSEWINGSNIPIDGGYHIG